MIKLLALALLVSTFSVFAQDKGDGCGLGWQVTNKRTLSATTTRGTTNGTVPPTFGMTTGTIGCERHSIVKNGMESIHYANANLDQLVIELAQGNGEYVNSFAATLGCSDASAFASTMQSNYSKIVTDSVNGSVLLENVKAQIKSNNLSCSVM